MTKVFICDESRIHHHDAVFEGCDFADCYDRIAHNVAGISLRAWGVPQPVINILLKTMETMRFFCVLALESLSNLMVERTNND